MERQIAIVGSADPRRDSYNPPLRNIDRVGDAAGQLGRELARAGYRIMVYSSDPAYIEAAVVGGYVASGKAGAESIQVRYPQALGAAERRPFPEEATHPSAFDVRADPHPDWEVSFYVSLRDAAGVLLVGGGRSALAAGLIAQNNRAPLIAIATFGGSAQTVWALPGSDLATEAERNLMGRDQWQDDSAARLVQALTDQRRRLEARKAQQRRAERLKEQKTKVRALAATACILGAVGLALLGVFWSSPSPVLFGVFFFGTPLLAGASGGLVRTIMIENVDEELEPIHATPVASALGMIAGLITALLFVVAQWSTNPEIKDLDQGIPPGLNLLIVFALIVGFIGGFTLESVFGKLRRTDVVNVDVVAAPDPNR